MELLQLIITMACRFKEISREKVFSNSRKREIVETRYLICWVYSKLTYHTDKKLPGTSIEKYLKKGHPFFSTAINEYQKLIDTNKTIHEKSYAFLFSIRPKNEEKEKTTYIPMNGNYFELRPLIFKSFCKATK
jgi:hypothetical protein